MLERFDRDSVIHLLSELVKIKSPYFEENEVMAFADKWLRENGLDSSIFEYSEDKVVHFHGKDVIVPLKGDHPGPKVCLNGHLDTVNLCSGWTRNPWGELDGDRFYGVGALDMTGGAVAEMLAMKAFRDQFGNDFSGEILGTFVSDEEGPYGLGTNALIEAGLLDGVDVSVCCEPNAAFAGVSFPSVALGARGGYGLWIEVHGAAAHASKPYEGINAVEDAAAVIREIGNVEYRKDPKLGSGVYCVLGLESNDNACSVPDYAKIHLFRHTITGETPETIRSELVDAIARAHIRSQWKIIFREAPSEGSAGFMPYTVDENHPYTKLFLQCAETACGVRPSVSYFDSIGDFNYLGSRLHGAPVFLFGPNGEKFHGSDEYVTISTIQATARTLYEFLVKVLTSRT